MTIQQSFFNTTHLSGKELTESRSKAYNQNQKVLLLMEEGRSYTPFDVWRRYNTEFMPVPVTSIRRAMTTLTKECKLIKTSRMKTGRYGKVNHSWIKPKL